MGLCRNSLAFGMRLGGKRSVLGFFPDDTIWKIGSPLLLTRRSIRSNREAASKPGCHLTARTLMFYQGDIPKRRYEPEALAYCEEFQTKPVRSLDRRFTICTKSGGLSFTNPSHLGFSDSVSAFQFRLTFEER